MKNDSIGKAMTTGTRRTRKTALAQWVADKWGVCDVIAELRPGRTRAELESALYQWYARVNRRYLGRNWYKPENRSRRMEGVVFFEEGGGGWHGHVLLRPPQGVDPLNFVAEVPHLWSTTHSTDTPQELTRGFVLGGKMFARVVGPAPSDRLRVAQYSAKGLEKDEDVDASSWKLLDQLTPLRRSR